jgi:hypothetical protein
VDWAAEGSGFDIRQTYRLFSPPTTFGPALRQTDPPVEGVLRTLTPGGKLRTFPRLRMCRAVLTLARTVVFMVWGLIKIDASFTFKAGPRHVCVLGRLIIWRPGKDNNWTLLKTDIL